ncbi:hypothetical protein ACH5RR_040445 [Cinchona calisaya]|uniref:Ent-kaurenoic acid oxidase n=1 Tax=Cinchona calisaya TaxID=153742 RepID=A0ABD2XSD2_9GENT
MEYNQGCLFTALLMGVVLMYNLLRRANEWIYVRCLGAMKNTLPPGDLGWPLIGNMFSFFRAFKFGDPDSFISSFTNRYGQAPMYRALLFGKPSIIVTTAETCRKVLTDDDRFGPGWPKSVSDLVGKRGLHGVSNQEHKRLRQLIAAPVASREALSLFIGYIEDIAKTSFDKWEKMDKPIEFLTEMRKTAFKVMMNIIMGNEINDEKSLDYMEHEYTLLSNGLKSMAINLPGFAYYQALKARKSLVKKFGAIVYKRRMMYKGEELRTKKDLLTLMMEIQDDEGNKLSDEEIVDLIIIFLLAGHESSGHAVTWAIIFLQENPHILQKAKEEQADIMKSRSSSNIGLNFSEIRRMKYLQKVIEETLRLVNLSFALFREAKTDVNINGYTIPKGWRVLPWIRNVHFDPENYKNPMDFNPSRWDDKKIKLGTLIPFGAGSRLCPGADLAKLEISIFLHYFLLNYRLERINPGNKVQYLPITRPADKCLARIKKL